MTARHEFFATAPKGLEPLLAAEMSALGAADARETRAGVSFAGDLATAYRACLWSRLANRVLLPLARFPAATPEALYAGVRAINWADHLDAQGTLAVDANVSASAITHSHFAALKVKDAIVDQLRDAAGARPSVDTAQPDVRVNLYLARDEARVSLDLSGESLHRRGYRTDIGEAPLKENLAAAILLRAGWPAIAAEGGALVDPMCGSGTFLIEGAQIAADIAPGLQRTYYGFLRWRGHDPAMWAAMLDEAHGRREAGLPRLRALVLRGYDNDPRAIRTARSNVTRAGLGNYIQHTLRDLAGCEAEPVARGLVVVNPPYGERLGSAPEMPALYSSLGAALRRCYPGWRAAVFTGNPELGRMLNLRAHKLHTFWNGPIECKLLHIEIPGGTQAAVSPERAVAEGAEQAPMETGAQAREAPADSATPPARAGGAQDFANRLTKNYRHFGRWARREGIHAWRVYDADLHEYNFAIDIYECERSLPASSLPRHSHAPVQHRYVHVQEYQAPVTIDPRRAQNRLAQALAVIPQVLEVQAAQLLYKQRRRQSGGGQYEKLAERGEFHEVREGPCRFLVNFTDYLDTGLFLDHRLTRAMVGELAKGRRFLNLFAYTGTATVHAALAGATATTTVDMSHTYLDWAQRNLELNGIRGRGHEFIQADVLQWLAEPRRERYGVIFLDPPTFSRSKRMEDTLDIQRDHVSLITSAARLLEPDGVLVFSTNLRKFELERASLPGFEIRDITRATIPKDFERNPKIHQCFRITPAKPGR